MRTLILAGTIVSVLSLGACSTDPATVAARINAAVPDAYKIGCAAISEADGAFRLASPALVVAGKLTQADLDREAALFAVDQARCANPPADLVGAGNALVGDAAAVYLMVAAR